MQDRVLGGGLMPGSVNLVAGAPGIGKSTLLMQLAVALSGGHTSTDPERPDLQDDIVTAAAQNRPPDYETQPVVYISGEESVEQLKDRADRLNSVAPNLFVLNQTNVDDTLADITEIESENAGFSALIVDSIQAMYMNDIPSAAGTVSQIRECALQFLHYAKSTGVPVFLVGHVTKSGDIAGPKVLEHMVDTVLSLEGDSHYNHRILRSVKNRFGSTSEMAFLDMGDNGLREISNPGELFLSFDPTNLDSAWETPSGAAVTCSLEGSRPLCVEIQALATPTVFEFPKHRSSGIGLDRLHMLLAVLSKHARVRPGKSDVFLNAVGGLRLADPSIDLAAALAVASSLSQKALPMDTVFIGEVGLGGELRPVPQMEARLKTVQQLGFRKAVVAESRAKLRLPDIKSLEIIPMKSIGQTLKYLGY